MANGRGRQPSIRRTSSRASPPSGLEPSWNSLILPADHPRCGFCAGELGDCWFLSAITVAATRPELVAHCFVTTQLNSAGVVCVRFFKNGSWRSVLLDDRFPCTLFGTPKFASSRQPTDFWVMILEKAYAKLHGGYAAIEGGFVDEALVDLTGGVGGERVHLQREAARDADGFWAKLLRYARAGFLLGAGSPSGSDMETSAMGIVQGHACAAAASNRPRSPPAATGR